MKKLISISAIIFLIGCGGSSSSSNSGNDNISKTTINGKVADGYLINAKVCLDKNENYVCDSDEPSSYTKSDGSYSLEVESGDENKYPVIVEVGKDAIDTDTNENVSDEFLLFAPAGKYQFISPYTTLIKTQMDLNPQFSIDDAENVIKTKLGMPSADLFANYLKDNSYTSEVLHKVAKNLTSLFIQNYKVAKTNLNSTTKGYVLGFSFALTHTAYDNTDIKGAVKKAYKPNFAGIVTLPNDKEKVENIYTSVLNKLEAVKSAEIFTPANLVGKEIYAFDIEETYCEDSRCYDYPVKIGYYPAKINFTSTKLEWLEVNRELNESVLDEYSDVDDILANVDTAVDEWNATIKNKKYFFPATDDEWDIGDCEISNVAVIDLGNKKLNYNDVFNFWEDINMSDKFVEFQEGDKQYKFTITYYGRTLDEAVSRLESLNDRDGEDEGTIQDLLNEGIDVMEESDSVHCNFIATNENSGYIDCNGTKNGTYKMFEKDGYKFLHLKDFRDYLDDVWQEDRLFMESDNKIYWVDFVNGKKAYKDDIYYYNKSAINRILESLRGNL